MYTLKKYLKKSFFYSLHGCIQLMISFLTMFPLSSTEVKDCLTLSVRGDSTVACFATHPALVTNQSSTNQTGYSDIAYG